MVRYRICSEYESKESVSHLLDNGKRIDDPVKMANVFNHHFVNVGSNIDKSIPRTKKSPTDYLKIRNSDSFFFNASYRIGD